MVMKTMSVSILLAVIVIVFAAIFVSTASADAGSGHSQAPAYPVTGPAGASGLSNIAFYDSYSEHNSLFKSHITWCPEGKVAISGGHAFSGGGLEMYVVESYPVELPGERTPTGWKITARETFPTDEKWAILTIVGCADVIE
jgi:hypothetical protein